MGSMVRKLMLVETYQTNAPIANFTNSEKHNLKNMKSKEAWVFLSAYEIC